MIYLADPDDHDTIYVFRLSIGRVAIPRLPLGHESADQR
jgi:hypothetical protein